MKNVYIVVLQYYAKFTLRYLYTFILNKMVKKNFFLNFFLRIFAS